MKLDKILVPVALKYNEDSIFKNAIGKIVADVNNFNAETDKEYALNLSVNISRALLLLLEEIVQKDTKKRNAYALEIQKKDYLIKRLKDFIDSKDELDAELPDEDDADDNSDEVPAHIKALARRMNRN